MDVDKIRKHRHHKCQYRLRTAKHYHVLKPPMPTLPKRCELADNLLVIVLNKD